MTELPKRATTRNGGFSLLEVVLSLAICAIAMSLLGQLVGLAYRAAAASRDLTHAQLIAEAIMADFASGAMLPQTTSGNWELDDEWSYDASVTAGLADTINVITVDVRRGTDEVPVFSLTQWVFVPPEPEEETTETDDALAGGGA